MASLQKLSAHMMYAAEGCTNFGPAPRYDPVSYTHLDVYKRQDGKSTHILVSDEFFHFAISDKPAAWGKGFVKAVKIADRTFLLAGYALDVVCIYQAYMEDLTENGHVTYEKTGKVVVKLVSGELFAFIGGSIGAVAGAAFGPAGIIILGEMCIRDRPKIQGSRPLFP